MVTHPLQGEVWWGELEESGRRPFLVLTRSAAIPVLHSVTAAPLSRTIRGIPTEMQLGPDDGLPTVCAANFDGLRLIPKANLVERICSLRSDRLHEACQAINLAFDCR